MRFAAAAAAMPLIWGCAGAGPPRLGGCPVFPANNVWNTPVDRLPLDPNSSAYVASIGAAKALHPDFGPDGVGIPFVVVPAAQPFVPVLFTDYGDESDGGPYPVPADAAVENGGDRHVLVVGSGNCRLYELYNSFAQPDGSWKASSGAIFDLNANTLRRAGWTSADAAGLPITAGLVRYDEVASGQVRHAVRFTAPQTRGSYTWPARHYASSLTGSQYPPMGQRFRLRASYDEKPFSAEAQVILRALKRFGMILADNGSAWFVSGAPDNRWNNDHLNELKRIVGSDFEAVDSSSLVVSADSGEAKQSANHRPSRPRH